jgi:hypothetical protein
MVKYEADSLTLYKRWSLRPDVTVDDVRRFVVERILPAYERLSPDVELGLEAEADGRSVIAVQRWSSVLAHESAFTGASFEKWWVDYQPTLVDWDELVTVLDEWTTHLVDLPERK